MTARVTGFLAWMWGLLARQPKVTLITAAAVALVAGAATFLLVPGGRTPPNMPISKGVTLPGPFRVISVSPPGGDRQADGSDPVQVTFSAPLATGSPLPTVTPDVPGTWQGAADTWTFTPAVPFGPSTRVTVTVPGQTRSSRGRALVRATTASFTTRSYSDTALAEMLAGLGYMPGSWQQPNLGIGLATQYAAAASRAGGARALAYDPAPGDISFAQGYPASLAAQWQPGKFNVVLKGAIMAFQSEHGLKIDGSVSSALWDALFKARAAGDNNTNGYSYAVASKGHPETLTVYHDGQQVLHTLANTGGAGTPTVNGTFPVYLRFLHTIMSGTNPDGSHYSDPVSFVSYFNGGDAVHYFSRGAYGFPQSLGCVELPMTSAPKAYSYLTYGSLVTVTG
jgi:L,D-transpeptidase catalytic domain/Bacterial Ig-like domain